jgi:hypothetical protein
MSEVIVGPWTRLDLLKELLERETKRLQIIIEQYKEQRKKQSALIAQPTL